MVRRRLPRIPIWRSHVDLVPTIAGSSGVDLVEPPVGDPLRSDRELPPERASEYLEDGVPPPEDFAPTPPKPRSPLNRIPGKGTIRPALMTFALFWVASIPYWFGDRSAGGWVSHTAIFEREEYWRLFTALFTHSDMGHLASNTPLVVIFGWFLYAYFGTIAFPLTAFLIGAASNLATVYFYPANTQLVGASGMLYGMVALWLVLYVRFDTDHTVPMRFFRALAVALVLLFPTTFHETTSYQAHAWGFLFGLIGGWLLTFVARPLESDGDEILTPMPLEPRWRRDRPHS